MNDIPLPAIEPERLTAASKLIEFDTSRTALAAQGDTGAPGIAATAAEVAVAAELVCTVHKPIAEVMDQTLWTVHAEDPIDKVEAFFVAQGLSSAPVVGSNGAIVGMIGAAELAAFFAEGKNPKAVQAWEISRIKTFEVNPTDTVEDVARLMAENKVETMCVTEFGFLKGVVSSQDLLKEILNVLPADAARE